MSTLWYGILATLSTPSRWDVLQAFRTATASHASTFLHTLLERTPFPVRAIQVDGGSAFYAEFEAACAALGIRLFVLPPHSPQLNAHVERAQREWIKSWVFHTRECSQQS